MALGIGIGPVGSFREPLLLLLIDPKKIPLVPLRIYGDTFFYLLKVPFQFLRMNCLIFDYRPMIVNCGDRKEAAFRINQVG